MSDERKRIPGTNFEIDRKGQVFLSFASGRYPKGHQKIPQLVKGRIVYFDGKRNWDARGQVFELFGKRLKIAEPRRHLCLIHSNRREHNRKLREQEGVESLNRKRRPVKRNKRTVKTVVFPKSRPNYGYGLRSVFNALKDQADFASAVGVPVTGKEGATMSSYCPLV